MTRPRKELFSLDDTRYNHCSSRCVRRAYLCGSQDCNDYEHRRSWIIKRIKELSSVFATDVAAYHCWRFQVLSHFPLYLPISIGDRYW